MMDLDNFKTINDQYGHPIGDVALKAVADTLRSRTRVFDSIARYGGEEFVVVMPGTGPQDAMGAAERLRVAIENMPFSPEPGVLRRLTISIGVAFSDNRNHSAELLLQAADQAMYQAKRNGRNRVELAASSNV